jgi:hypothetical protein
MEGSLRTQEVSTPMMEDLIVDRLTILSFFSALCGPISALLKSSATISSADLSSGPLALPPLLSQPTSLHEFQFVRLPPQSTTPSGLVTIRKVPTT